jgi:hypothetical protein
MEVCKELQKRGRKTFRETVNKRKKKTRKKQHLIVSTYLNFSEPRPVSLVSGEKSIKLLGALFLPNKIIDKCTLLPMPVSNRRENIKSHDQDP